MNTFYARREVNNVTGNVIHWVTVAQTPELSKRRNDGLVNGTAVCLEGFRTGFGFLPRKGKTYRITVREFDVEEVTE